MQTNAGEGRCDDPRVAHRRVAARHDVPQSLTWLCVPAAPGNCGYDPADEPDAWFSPPGWVRLVRTGDLFEAYQSLNGTAWDKIGSDTIPMGETVYVGLAATSQQPIVGHDRRHRWLRRSSASRRHNEPPAVSITSPTAQSQYTAPGDRDVSQPSPRTPRATVAVDFYADSTLIAAMTQRRMRFPGRHRLRRPTR